MKILKLQFKNLNSLYGEWEIDFTHPAYISSGIFAMTGPTGSGKSTILDAVCLALYQRTPRQKTLNQSINEVISRDTGECYAKLLFEAGGQQFLSCWSQQRARKSPQGSLQPAKHEISLFPQETLLTSGLKETLKVVTEKVGMDFERFTRSVLLAQGEFDKFLHANDAEKAAILEKITGTEVYAQISARIFARSKKEQTEKVALCEKEKDLYILPEEEEASYYKKLKSIEAEFQQQSQEQKEHESLIKWHESLHALEIEIQGHTKKLRELEEEKNAFAPKENQWQRAEMASKVEPIYAVLETLRNDEKQAQESKKQAHEKASEINKELPILKENLHNAEKQYEAAKNSEGQQRALFVQMRETDNAIRLQAQKLDTTMEEKNTLSQKVQQIQSDCNDLKSKQESAQSQVRTSIQYLKQYAHDAKLESQLPLLKAKIAALQTLKQEANAVLQNFRQDLREGQPCPVCGSCDHPIAKKTSGERGFLNPPATMKDAIFKYEEEINNLYAKFGSGHLNVKELEIRQEKWAYHSKTNTEFESKTNTYRAKEEELQKQLKTESDTLQQKTKALEDLQKIYDETKREREGRYGQDDPQQQEDALMANLKSLEKQEKTCDHAYQEKKNLSLRLNTEIEMFTVQCEAYRGKIQEKTEEFLQALKGQKFADEGEFLMSRMDAAERVQVEIKSKDLHGRKLALQTKITTFEEQYTQKKKEKSCEKDVKILKEEIAQAEQTLMRLQEEIQSIKLKLEKNNENKSGLGDLYKQIQLQEKECARWDKLNSLIGSSDGKKYREFAQSLTFDQVIGHANEQLKKISDRYLLCRVIVESKDQQSSASLELSVIDQYQANEVRPVSNLSGGETFLISMALALGLASMSSDQVQVDTLFLDEGFGTLDEETLQSTLDALSFMHQEGKTIGIISHVASLHDIINTQIIVCPRSGGKSILTGVGVRKIGP
ncbi:MAG: AAA family ATPase [Spirochaetia bacterium]